MKHKGSVGVGFDAAVGRNDGTSCEGCDGSGIRCPATPSCQLREADLAGWTIIERCDTCERYPDDLSAGAALFREVRWIECASGGHHAIGQN